MVNKKVTASTLGFGGSIGAGYLITEAATSKEIETSTNNQKNEIIFTSDSFEGRAKEVGIDVIKTGISDSSVLKQKLSGEMGGYIRGKIKKPTLEKQMKELILYCDELGIEKVSKHTKVQQGKTYLKVCATDESKITEEVLKAW